MLTAMAISSETCTRCLSAEERRKLTAAVAVVAAAIWEERLQFENHFNFRLAHSANLSKNPQSILDFWVMNDDQ